MPIGQTILGSHMAVRKTQMRHLLLLKEEHIQTPETPMSKIMGKVLCCKDSSSRQLALNSSDRVIP